MFFSFLLFTWMVKGKEVEEYPSYNNKTMDMVLEFPYDRNNTNTFARTTFVAQEEMTNFTVCFAFMVNALKSAKKDEMQLLQLKNGDGETLAEIIFTVQPSLETFYETMSFASLI